MGPKPKPITERVARHVRIEPGPLATPCHIWTGVLHDGRPMIQSGSMKDGTRRPRRVHNVLWRAVHGEPPQGHDIHHRCENKRCVNIEHLELLLHDEHMRHHQAQRPLAEKARSSRYAMHVRWHEGRNMRSPNCEFCSASSASPEDQARVFQYWEAKDPGAWPVSVPACGG